MYKLSNVRKDYRKGRQTVHALRGVDLEVADGDWISIQGPTGHGKSTLLQILDALDRPTSGTVEFHGVDLATRRETQLTGERAASISFIFQSFNLIPTLSAQENVETALVPRGIPAAERKERAAHALADVGLAERARHLAAELSGGQMKGDGEVGGGSPSPGRWSRNRRCYWPTSPPATWTKAPGTRS